MDELHELLEGKSIDEIQELADSYGIDVSTGQIEAFLNGEDVELSLDELEKVSGGSCSSYTCC